MAFYDYDTAADHAQQQQQQTGSRAAQADPDVQHALQGVFTGKYATFAAQLPTAWSPQTRNQVVAQQIARDKGIDTSGLDASNNFAPTNTGTPFAVQIAPYAMGAVSGGLAATAPSAGGAGLYGPAEAGASVYGPTEAVTGAGAWGGGTAASAAEANALVQSGAAGGSVAGGGTMASTPLWQKILTGAGGKGGGALGAGGPWDWIAPGISAAFNLVGQSRQLGANQDALSQQLASTKYATDAATKSQAEQLAFLKSQAAYDAATAETNRSGNYEQWAAKQRLLGTVGEALGLPPRSIPAYVPLPAYGGAPGAAPGATAAPAGGGGTAAPGAAASGYVNVQGQPIATDPDTLRQQINASAQQQFGRDATADEIARGIQYASKPDLYSDKQWRIGWNDYLAGRVFSGGGPADPKLAGSAGIIQPPPRGGYGGPVGSYL